MAICRWIVDVFDEVLESNPDQISALFGGEYTGLVVNLSVVNLKIISRLVVRLRTDRMI